MNVVAANPRTVVAEVVNEGRRIVLHWGDGHASRFHALWLRHVCRCEACGTWESAIRPLRLTEIPEDIAAESAVLSDAGELEVVWANDSHRSRYAADWLRGHCPSAAERARRRFRPEPWGPEIASDLPQADYATAKGDEAARLDMLEALRDRGFVLVRGAPAEADATAEIAALAGPLRITNYGSVYDFRYKPDALVYGDLNVKLDPHTDEPYRQAPPSVTIFHFVRAAKTGGESILVDSFRIGRMLKEEDPEGFALLARERATFQRKLTEQQRDFRMRAPIFSLDDEGEVAGFRLLDRGFAPLDLAEELVEPYYRAYRRLLTLLYDEANQLNIQVAAGEALFFNNQRVLHGRTAFDTDGDRYMRTCHVELDEFHSNLRVLARRLGREGADLILPSGALS